MTYNDKQTYETYEALTKLLDEPEQIDTPEPHQVYAYLTMMALNLAHQIATHNLSRHAEQYLNDDIMAIFAHVATLNNMRSGFAQEALQALQAQNLYQVIVNTKALDLQKLMRDYDKNGELAEYASVKIAEARELLGY